MRKTLIVLLSISLLLAGCHKKKKIITHKFPIKSAIAKEKKVPIFLENIGHVKPLIKIDVRSRVEGELVKVHFKEGDEVQKGQLLFTIDPRNFVSDLNHATGVLDENIAKLKLAKEKVKRYGPLYKEDYISQLNFDTLLTNVEVYKALIEQNTADVEKAKTNLEYCYIYSPVEGKTSIYKIDEGNLITKDSKDALVTINQLKPTYVEFSIPEKYLTTIKKYTSENDLKVRVAFDSFEKSYIEGDLSLLNNEINTSTGMIKFRSNFENEDKRLWPGQFVKTRLILKMEPKAIIIPYQAIQMTSFGPEVFVVGNGNRVEVRKVILSQREDSNVIIEKGISVGEKVVIKGQINLVNGSYVFESGK